VRIQGRNVLIVGDDVTVSVDSASFMIRRVVIDTMLEGRPVTIRAEYRGLAHGPTYQARAMLEYQDRHIEVVVENFDFVREGPR